MNIAIQNAIQTPEVQACAPLLTGVRPFTDLDLQLCRRLDWRFLLHDTHLGNVAYFGPKDTALAIALERFSDCLTMFSKEESVRRTGPLDKTFDGTVISSPTASTIEGAKKLLKPGGWLYAELGISGRFSVRSQGVNGLRATMRDAGFSTVRAYWHRPSFEACREIVPLDDAAALEYVLSRRHQDFAGRIKAWAGRCAMRTGLLPFALPGVSLLGYKN